MAKKTFTGRVKSVKMQKTVVVELERLIKHPVYKKTLKRTRRIKANTAGNEGALEQLVVIEETKPIAGDVHFKIIKVVKE